MLAKLPGYQQSSDKSLHNKQHYASEISGHMQNEYVIGQNYNASLKTCCPIIFDCQDATNQSANVCFLYWGAKQKK